MLISAGCLRADAQISNDERFKQQPERLADGFLHTTARFHVAALLSYEDHGFERAPGPRVCDAVGRAVGVAGARSR